MPRRGPRLAGKRAPLVPEELATSQSWHNRSAIERHQTALFRSLVERVYQPGNKFLAGPAFSRDEH